MSFHFGDQVRVVSAEPIPEYADRVGLVVGISPDEGMGSAYAVRFPDEIHTVMFWQSDLEIAPTASELP